VSESWIIDEFSQSEFESSSSKIDDILVSCSGMSEIKIFLSINYLICMLINQEAGNRDEDRWYVQLKLL
jgi:hypothetical protein